LLRRETGAIGLYGRGRRRERGLHPAQRERGTEGEGAPSGSKGEGLGRREMN